MRIALVTLTVLMGLVGCDQINKVKVDNPVMPPAPPRVRTTQNATQNNSTVEDLLLSENEGTVVHLSEGERAVAAADSSSMLSPVDYRADNAGQREGFSESDVIATVSGSPIFVADVLDRYGPDLARARAQLPPADFAKLQKSLLKRDLKGHLERRLLINSLHAMLKPEQLKMLNDHLDKRFEKETDRLKQEFGVSTTHELKIKLQEQKQTSIANLRTAFVNQQMAMEYLAAKSRKEVNIGRPALLDYYEERISDYETAPKVKWQQITVNFAKHGGKQRAFAHLQQAIEELQKGAKFAEVVQKFSDGPRAAQGGHWGWIQTGSLANKEVEQALFELPFGVISEVLVDDTSYRLVKVIDRKSAGRVSFENVQDEIKEKLTREARREATMRVLDELYENAVIETIFDDEPQ
jgi:hypothetical protein